MTPSASFPHLTADNHQVTSPPADEYNCVAWAAGDTMRWWQPGVHWPVAVPPGAYGIEVLEQAFRALGYDTCDDGWLEPGFEKVALYGDDIYYTHIARQLQDGRWTSKLGAAEDIKHDATDGVGGGIYGTVLRFMKRVLAGG